MKLKQKGMEMPIQIFIILFVLLAVAMLVLQMVSQQFEQQQAKMKEEEMKRKYNEQVASMNEKCSSLCGKANSEVSLKSKAGFCIQAFTDGLDVTKNGLVTDYTDQLMFGIGVCEDQIYCPLVYDCKIGGGTRLTMEKCKEILCAYWTEQGFTAQRKKEALKRFIQPGSCYDNPDNRKYHWYTALFDSDGSGSVDQNEAVCPK